MAQAPRLSLRSWQRCARGALAGLCLWLTAMGTGADAAVIETARYQGETTRYGHLVLGKDHNWSELHVELSTGARVVFAHDDLVFEDTAPRIVDLDGDGIPEVVVVESSPRHGARLAIYGMRDGALAPVAQGPFIGTSYRWLAVAGVADLDGDGITEIAYVDRPHLAKVLRIWRFVPGQGLVHAADLSGVTNHRIGDPQIVGGVRTCGGGPELILADAQWRRVLAVTFDGSDVAARDIGPVRGPQSLSAGQPCH